MGDQLVTKIMTLIAAIKALSDQMAALTDKVDDINNNNNANNNNTIINNNNNNINDPNRGGGPIPVIRVDNNNHTIVTYKKLEHTSESDLEYYERRYYNKLKDDHNKFIIYCFMFCYNKDYSLTDLLRHASRMAGNSRKMIKDIVKHSLLITYIQRYLNVKVDETFDIINNGTTEINNEFVVGNNRINESYARILTQLQEEINVAWMTEAFLTSVEPVKKHLVTKPIVSMEKIDALDLICDNNH
jgi:hypothetical protein